MTTTELIDLLKKYEHGGATGRPREVMLCIGDGVYDTNITDISTGDGLFTELFLKIPHCGATMDGGDADGRP